MVIFYPKPFIALSGIVRSSSKLHIETKITPGSGITLEPISQSADYPLGFGFGTALDFTKLLFAADYYTQQWSEYRLDGSKGLKQSNYSRVSAGVEYINSKDFLTSYYKRIAIRLGGSWAQLPFKDETGESVQEMLATFGVGFPFNRNLGRIDLALEAGKRYSVDSSIYSERIMRISASVTSAEKWFQRIF